MDKLKPILAHKFWIVFGVALLVPVIGWWMSTAELKAEIDKRRKAVDDAFKGAVAAPNTPNKDWEAKLKAINGVQDQQKKESARRLWESQRALMTWPEDIRPLMTEIAVREDIPKIPQKALDIYRFSYFDEARRIRRVIKPYVDGKGVVVLADTAIPTIARDKWEFQPPRPEEMWNAQEDIHLWHALLMAIAAVNGDAAAINDAAIRRIDQVELVGGTLKAAPAGGGSAGATGGGAGAGGGAIAAPLAAGSTTDGGGGGLGATSNRGGAAGAPVAFTIPEEFGPQEAGGGDAAGGGGATSAPPAAGGAAMTLGGGPVDGKGGAQKEKIRYIDDDPNLPYKLRGFYIRVTMQHQKVPDLIASLTNMAWPAQIIRVQQLAKYDDVSGGIRSEGMGNLGANMPPGGPAPDAGAAFGGVGAFGAGAPASRPPGGGFEDNFRRPGAGDAGPADENAKRVYDAAMSDPYLAEVVLAGVMTLYMAPKDLNAPGGAGPAGAAPANGVPADGAPADAGAADPSNPTATSPTAGAPPATTEPATTEPDPADPTKTPAEPKPDAPKSDTGKPAAPGEPPPAKPDSKPDADPKPEPKPESKPENE